MGWLDFLRRPPSRDEFARLVTAQLQKLSPGTKLTYNREQFLIERGSEGFINLTNLYFEYCQAPRGERAKVLERFLRGCLGTTSFELPEEFGDVHPDLLPVVRSRFYLESIGLQARSRGSEPVAVPQQLIGDHLSLSLVYDLPQAMRSILQDDLEKWGVSFYEALEAARHNLEQAGHVAFATLQGDNGSAVYVSATGDNYDASRLVLLDLVKKFSVRGDHIAMVPNRDTLLVTGSDDASGLEVMAKIAQESFAKPRPISTVALRLVDEGWESWLPDRDSKLFSAFRELRLRTVGMEYNDQKQLLEKVYAAEQQNLFVASFSAVQMKGSSTATSYSVWSQGVTTLLPETDNIVLLKTSGEMSQVEVAASGRWERVQEVVGHLMKPVGIYPERYRVEEFPTEMQLAAIGKSDLPMS